MAEHAAVANTINFIKRNRVGNMESEKMSTRQINEVIGPSLKLVHFNISGQAFTVSNQLTKKYPTSKLASPTLLEDHWVADLGVYYFDRDPALFNTVLNIFRYDVLNVPAGYDKKLVMEEINYWEVPHDGKVNMIRQDNEEEACIEAEFQWLENRIPPPPPTASVFMKKRYLVWCFITDPLGPYTKYRKLSVAHGVMSISLAWIYLVIYGLGTSVYYRKSIVEGQIMNMTDMETAAASLGCLHVSRIECFLKSEPVLWIQYAKFLLSVCFIAETMVRLMLCPGWAYFKSVSTWLDIVAGLCAMFFFAFEQSTISGMMPRTEITRYVSILMQSLQVLRVFKIFQYASLVDGLMIMMLTMRACFKELLLLVMYLLLAMFLYATIISFVELQAETGTGIPDCIHGYWWAIITMTTVGYGDYYPTTVLGYMVGVMCAVTGIILTALPVAVIGSNFNMYWEHNKKRRSLLMASIDKELDMEDSSDDYSKLKHTSPILEDVDSHS